MFIRGNIMNLKELKQKIDKLLEKEKKFEAFYWGDDDIYSYYDVVAPKTNKGYVMLEVADILKVKRENTIAYGAEINDELVTSIPDDKTQNQMLKSFNEVTKQIKKHSATYSQFYK